MSKHYDEASVIASVRKKAVVNLSDKTICYNPNNHQIGNGTWGKIDYLCHYCGYTLLKDNAVNVGNSNGDYKIHNDKNKENKVKKMK